MKTNINGVGVALITPFASDFSVDYDALGKVIDRITSGGVDYIVALGTTAETPTLTCEEKAQVVKYIVAKNNKRLPIILGLGGNNTADVIANLKKTDLTGIDAILSVTPYYNKPSQEGLYRHYKAVAEASSLPIILYNVPGRTGVNLSAATTLRLAHECPNIIGTKEASGNLSQIAYILRDRPEGFAVVSGDDNMTLAMMSMGAEGVISVAAHVYPQTFTRMVRLLSEGNYKEAAALHLSMIEATDALFEEGNPAGVKAALANAGVISNHLRLPLVEASEALCHKLAGLIAKYDLK